MKAKAPYILLIIFAGIIIFLYFSKPSGHKQEVERLNELVEEERAHRKEAWNQVFKVRDSSKVAFAEIERAHLERLKTTEERILKETAHSQVIHVRTRRDSERDSVLLELYPSIGVR